MGAAANEKATSESAMNEKALPFFKFRGYNLESSDHLDLLH